MTQTHEPPENSGRFTDLSAAEYAQAVKHIKNQIKEAGDQANQSGDDLNQFAVSAARNIQDAIAKGIQFNKIDNGFKGLVHSFAQTIEQISAQAIAADVAGKLFGKDYAKGDFGGLLGGLFGGGKDQGKGKGKGADNAGLFSSITSNVEHFFGSVFDPKKGQGLFSSIESSVGGFFSSLFGGGGQRAGGGSSAGGFIGTLGTIASAVFHDGGIVGAGAPVMRNVPIGAFAGAPRLHSGGAIGLAPDERPAILQTGERVQSRAEVAAGNYTGPHTIKNVLVDDKRRITEHLTTPDGEQAILQIIHRNADAVAHDIQGKGGR